MAKTPSEPEGKICIAQIGAAHGVRGEVRIKLFSDDPNSLTQYGPLETADGKRHFKIVSARFAKTVFVCRIKGLTDRNEAEALNGVRLYVDREQLPELEEEEFYHSDLIGLDARLEDGTVLGSILAVHDFGAGDLLDIVPSRGKGLYVPFTREAVPHVSLDEGYVTVIPPEGLLDEADESERSLEGEGADFSAQPELLDGLKKD
ncbi:16S rRNA processing protein RimM [Cohaesibacter sp. ES.047]|uniref:ribosome maturation factor RimM n=1 Tax=Cohaesibacter sp. ES.047 TaxID=1798205 RepID=UPI000BB6DC9E|nr:ribosome maturation factor RimM [Cohaesibacter sp. ES.047]SNY90553.1 16S rRNA processing protein RimM [Cohaesibacter sp. ES.047]